MSSTQATNNNTTQNGQNSAGSENNVQANAAPTVNPANGMVTYQTNPQNPGQPTSSLYVGDLHPEISEAQIFDKFSPIGTVISIRVCRDMVSRKSLGYAYVNFSVRAEAEKAIETLNFEELKNRQMRIMWSQRDPSLRKSGVGNVFIKNLEKNIQMRDIYDTFSAFGDILSCKIAFDDNGISKGYGFVHYKNVAGADNAILNLHNMQIYEKTIYVCKFIPRAERDTTEGDLPRFNNVFVKNFGDEMTEEKFQEIFSVYGPVISMKVEKGEDNISKGFGFVCYKECESAVKAVEEMNEREINGRKLFVGRALKKSERQEILRKSQEKKKLDRANKFAPGVNLYVKNLDDSVTDEILKIKFSNFGTITSAKVMVDSINGRSKGFGFVCFQYAEEATRAVTEMSGEYVGSKPLYVALAQRKDERRAQLANQYVQRQLSRSGYGGATGGFGGISNQMYNQSFSNQSLAFALNRPNFMNAMPQMSAAAARGRFPQQVGPMQNIRHAMPTNVAHPFMNAMAQRPNMRPIVQNLQNMIGLNPNMRQQGQNLSQQQRQSNIVATNTRLTRPPNMSGYRGITPPNMQMSQMRMQQPIELDDLSNQNMENMAEDARKQIVGESLFNQVAKLVPQEICAKVTGMLIEIELGELKSMIEQHVQNTNNSRLSVHVAKALHILESQRNQHLASASMGPNSGMDQVVNGQNGPSA